MAHNKREMSKLSVILILTVLAVASVLYLKTLNPPRTYRDSEQTSTKKLTFFLFHNPKDHDEECRKIYAFADRAEKELTNRVIVRRPDIDRERALLTQYSVRVLPTILIVSPLGIEQARFEGEGELVEAALQKAIENWKLQ